MTLQSITYRLLLLLSILPALLTTGCEDTPLADFPDYTVSGEDVTMSVSVALPVMESATRADLDAASLDRVSEIWVRTYSSVTGEATSDWQKETVNTITAVEPSALEIELQTKSGPSHIVAVANVDNPAVKRGDLGNPRQLGELLEEADTWQDFLDIAVASPSTKELVRAPHAPLPMAGFLSDVATSGSHPSAGSSDSWQERGFQSYFIPVVKGNKVKMEGSIHLRRLVSHISFNIIPGDDNMVLDVESYTVCSVPRWSWLHERGSADGHMPNFGDTATEETVAQYYADVPEYGEAFINSNPDGSFSFDWWQGENKHTGIAETYHDRASKNATTGLFTSLSGETWTNAQTATYVVINASVEYKDPIMVNDKGEVDDGEDAVASMRTGRMTYLIHLGYISGDGDVEKSKDFNCFRNTDYTYNVTINGVDDIRVDAFASLEKYHGEEGLVVDMPAQTIELDCHYAAFNIHLSEEEMNSENFGFIINAYDSGRQITITEANPQAIVNNRRVVYYDETMTEPVPEHYYNWIEMRPTIGQNVLATYVPRYGQAAADSPGTFLLTDLKGGGSNLNAACRSESGWYTVFVNEYTYEPTYTGAPSYADERMQSGSGRPNWMGYVNQNPRRFYIRVTNSTSPDGQSSYANSKYGVSQQSIMTYYSNQTYTPAEDGLPPGTAIGVERRNETEGMNLRHLFTGGNSVDNGRWNVAQWLNGSISSESLSINGSAEGRPLWRNFVVANSFLQVGAVGADRAQGGPAIPAHTIASGNPWPMPDVQRIAVGGHDLPEHANYGNPDMTFTFNDPQGNDNYTIEAINACMNRNRDNNGNGRIDPDELRWYVPAMGKYLRIILGAESLPDALMEYSSVTQLPHVPISAGATQWSTTGVIRNDYYSRYMFVSSNGPAAGDTKYTDPVAKNVLWAMEGTSMSSYHQPSQWARAVVRPWQVRCIRNLGSDMTNVTKGEKVTRAYVHEPGTHTFHMTYYDVASIRPNQYFGNGIGAGMMPIHTINSRLNMVYYGFEYKEEDIDIPSEYIPDYSDATAFNITLDRLTAYIDSNPCPARYGAGWRIPNQVELAIMRLDGRFVAHANKTNTTWLSCTFNYFNYLTGAGSSNPAGCLPLIETPIQGTQLTQSNLSGAKNPLWSDGFFIRCVRDVR